MSAVPTTKQVVKALKELHEEYGLDCYFHTKDIAEKIGCDPAVLFDGDYDTGPLFDLRQSGRVSGDLGKDKTKDFTGKSWALNGGRVVWDEY